MNRKASIWRALFTPFAWLIVLVSLKLGYNDIVKTVSVIAFLQSCGTVYQFYQRKNDENS